MPHATEYAPFDWDNEAFVLEGNSSDIEEAMPRGEKNDAKVDNGSIHNI